MKSSVHSIGILLFILVGAILSWPMAEKAEAVRANTPFTVNSLNDSDDGVCDSSHCSLREAINAANSQNGADTITFRVEGTITLGSTLPQITSPDTLTISAEPRTVAISGNDSVRIFSVASGASLSVTGLALVHGNITGSGGGDLQLGCA